MLSGGNSGWAAALGLVFAVATFGGGPDRALLAAPEGTSPTTDSGRAGVNPADTIDTSEQPVAVLPPEVSFGEVAVGEQAFEIVTLTNDGDSQLSVVGVDVTGDSFFLGADGCGGRTLEARESCEVQVRFEAQRAGDFDGLLSTDFDDEESASSVLTASARLTPPPPTTAPPAMSTTTTVPAPASTTTPPATSTPPTTAPGNIDEDVAALRACDERASIAEVAYASSLEMTVGVESEVAVVIGVGGVSPPTPPGSTPNPATTIAPAELTCFIELELSGTGFEIETPVQSGDFSTKSTGQWFWDVTPQRAGQLDLELRIVPKISTAFGFQRGTPQPPFTAAISVEAVPRTAWQQVTDASSGLVGHPLFQLAVAAGLVGGAGSYVKGLLARRREVREGDDDEARGYL